MSIPRVDRLSIDTSVLRQSKGMEFEYGSISMEVLKFLYGF